jgi:hypothetical protein
MRRQWHLADIGTTQLAILGLLKGDGSDHTVHGIEVGREAAATYVTIRIESVFLYMLQKSRLRNLLDFLLEVYRDCWLISYS